MGDRVTTGSGQGTGAADLDALLQSVAAGDRAAFQRLYRSVAPKLLGVIFRISGTRAVAEEVLQTAFLKIWQNADRYSPAAGGALAWLCAIARNAAIDQIRSDRARRQSDVPLDDNIQKTLFVPAGAGEVDAQALRRCLDGLESEARECIVLAYCWGSSREELATRFGRPVNTIKTLLLRNLKTLATCLGSP